MSASLRIGSCSLVTLLSLGVLADVRRPDLPKAEEVQGLSNAELLDLLRPAEAVISARLERSEADGLVATFELAASPKREFPQTYSGLLGSRGVSLPCECGIPEGEPVNTGFDTEVYARSADRYSLRHARFHLTLAPQKRDDRGHELRRPGLDIDGQRVVVRLGKPEFPAWRLRSLVRRFEGRVPEFPFAPWPGAMLWDPDQRHQRTGSSNVRREYVTDAPFEDVLDHYSRVLEALSIPVRREGDSLWWSGEETVAGLTRIEVRRVMRSRTSVSSDWEPRALFDWDVAYRMRGDSPVADKEVAASLQTFFSVDVGFESAEAAEPYLMERKRQDEIGVMAASFGRKYDPSRSIRSLGYSVGGVSIFDPVDEYPVIVLAGWGGSDQAPDSSDVRRTHEQLVPFLETGGTLVVLAPSTDRDFRLVPTPQGEKLEGWGSVQDGLGAAEPSVVEGHHPILASLRRDKLDASLGVGGVNSGDARLVHSGGQITKAPANAQFLLRRRSDLAPIVITYPVGKGRVLVAAGLAPWESSPHREARQALLREILSWARNEVSTLFSVPGGAVSLDAPVENRTDRPAASVRFAVRELDSDRFLIEKLVALGVPARRRITAHFEAVWPEDTPTGVYVVEHALLDGEGSVIQEVRRRLGALVTVVTRDKWDATLASWREPRQQFPYTRPRVSLVVPDGEEVTAGTMGIFRYRVVNESYEEKKLRLYYAVGDGPSRPLRTLQMESGEHIEGDVTLLPSRGQEHLTLHLFEEDCDRWDCDRPTPVPTEPWGYLQSANTTYRVVEPKSAQTKE